MKRSFLIVLLISCNCFGLETIQEETTLSNPYVVTDTERKAFFEMRRGIDNIRELGLPSLKETYGEQYKATSIETINTFFCTEGNMITVFPPLPSFAIDDEEHVHYITVPMRINTPWGSWDLFKNPQGPSEAETLMKMLSILGLARTRVVEGVPEVILPEEVTKNKIYLHERVRLLEEEYLKHRSGKKNK